MHAIAYWFQYVYMDFQVNVPTQCCIRLNMNRTLGSALFKHINGSCFHLAPNRVSVHWTERNARLWNYNESFDWADSLIADSRHPACVTIFHRLQGDLCILWSIWLIWILNTSDVLRSTLDNSAICMQHKQLHSIRNGRKQWSLID